MSEHRNIAVMAVAADQKSASCSCGWKASCDDPATLQLQISAHYQLECNRRMPQPEVVPHIPSLGLSDEESRQESIREMRSIPACYYFMRRVLPDWMFAQRYPEMLTR